MKNLNKQDDKVYITYLIRNIYKSDDLAKFISKLKKIEIKDFNFSFSKDVSLPL